MASVKVDDDDDGLASSHMEHSPPVANAKLPPRITLSSSESFPSNYGTFEASALAPPVETPQHLTYWSGVCLVVGNQIGAGIFGSPAAVNGSVGSMGMSLLVWIVAGCLAWAGAGSLSLRPSL